MQKLFAPMKITLAIILLFYPLSTAIANTTPNGHADHAMMMEAGTPGDITIELTPTKDIKINTPTILNFTIRDKQGALIEDKALDIVHEKIFHLVGVRNDLNQFFHIHPTPSSNPGVFSVEHTFAAPGTYWVWAEVSKDNKIYSVKQSPIEVNGEGQRDTKTVNFSRGVDADQYLAVLEAPTKIVAEKATSISIDIHTKAGAYSELDTYLGTSMHLSIVKDDGEEFIHTHPNNTQHTHSLIPIAQADTGAPTFTITFPKAGLYKMFAQFRPKDSGLTADQSITAAFWVNVEEEPSPLHNTTNNRKKYALGAGIIVVLGTLIAGVYVSRK